MKPQEVFPLTVQVREGAAAVLANAGSLTIKPSIPGALVEPREQVLDATQPKNSVTFQVAPVAKGKLPNASVKVFQQNHWVQDIALGMKSKTQRLTWLLALLTLALPPLVTYYTRDHPFRGTIPRETKPSAVAANAPKNGAKNNADKDKDKDKEKAKADEAKPSGAAAAGAQQPPRQPNGQGQQQARPRPPNNDPTGPADQPVIVQYGATPGLYVEYVVKKSVYDAVTSETMPSIKYIVESDPPSVLDNNPSDGLSWFAWGIGHVYELMCNTASLGTFLFAVLLGLTTLSWVIHKTQRRNMNKVVTLAAEPRVEGRHLSGREQVVPVADSAD
jgi:hypothetical protein